MHEIDNTEFVKHEQRVLENGMVITFYCREDSPSLDEALQEICNLIIENLKRELNL